MAEQKSAANVDSAASKLLSLLPDDFVDHGLDSIDAAAEHSEEETQDDEEQKSSESEPDASSEDADATSEGDAEAEASSEESEEETEESETPQTWIVKVDGKETEVSAEELVAGYQRQADYTRKTMKLAEERKAHAADVEQTRVVRDEYASRLAELKKVLERARPAEPDWDKLRQENPTEFAATWAEYQRRTETERRVADEQARIKKEQDGESLEKLNAHLAEEREKLFAAIPAWKDAAVAKQEQIKMLEFAEKEFGLSKEAVSEFTDHRAFLMLHMAMKYADLRSGGRKVVQEKAKKAPVLRPGQPKPKVLGQKRELERAKERLRRTGRVDDAKEVFMQMLPDDV